jgi:tetratricopeptide (TPR) repeat protein
MDPNDLVKILEGKLEQSPEDSDLQGRLADLLLSQGDLGRSEELFHSIVRKYPRSPVALWGLARINWHRQNFDAAHTYLRLLSGNKDHKMSKDQALMMARLSAGSGNLMEAAKWLDAAIAQDSSLLQTEMPLLRFIRRSLIRNSGTHQGSNGSSRHFILLEMMTPSGEQGASVEEAQQYAHLQASPLEDAQEAVSFEEVAGLQGVKKEVGRELVRPLYGGKAVNPRILLYGPSGCGKSFLIRALETETQLTFVSVKPPDLLELGYEEMEWRLDQLLQQARTGRPAVILIEDVEWLLSGMDTYKWHLWRQLSQALASGSLLNSRIALVATTRKPWLLEPEALRSGGLDRQIFVPPPSLGDKLHHLRLLQPSLATERLGKFVPALRSLGTYQELSDLVAGWPRLTPKRLLVIAKRQHQAPTLGPWFHEAKRYLSPRHAPLHYLWPQIRKHF